MWRTISSYLTYLEYESEKERKVQTFKKKKGIYLKKQEEKDALHRQTQLSAAFMKHFKYVGKNGLQVKGWEKTQHANAIKGNYSGQWVY